MPRTIHSANGGRASTTDKAQATRKEAQRKRDAVKQDFSAPRREKATAKRQRRGKRNLNALIERGGPQWT
jgi:hypothetical protein